MFPKILFTVKQDWKMMANSLLPCEQLQSFLHAAPPRNRRESQFPCWLFWSQSCSRIAWSRMPSTCQLLSEWCSCTYKMLFTQGCFLKDFGLILPLVWIVLLVVWIHTHHKTPPEKNTLRMRRTSYVKLDWAAMSYWLGDVMALSLMNFCLSRLNKSWTLWKEN